LGQIVPKFYRYSTRFSLKSQSRAVLQRRKRRGRKKRRCLRFSVGFPGNALTASRASVATLAIFASRRAAKTLVGEPPQTRLWDSSAQTPLCYFGTKCPKIRPLRCASSPHKVLRLCGAPHAQSNCLRHCRLSLLFLFVLAVRDAQQMINIGLDRHGLPHLLLCRSVVSVECLFPRRQLAAFSF